MGTYAVSYDLRKPGRNYEPLWGRLKEWRAVRVLESLWVIPEANSAAAVRDDLVRYIDSNDGLLVAGLTGELAWQRLQGSSDQFLLNKFAA